MLCEKQVLEILFPPQKKPPHAPKYESVPFALAPRQRENLQLSSEVVTSSNPNSCQHPSLHHSLPEGLLSINLQ